MDKTLLERTVGTIVSNYPQIIPHLSGDVFAVLCKHYGPGEHDNGSPQEVHAGDGGGEAPQGSEGARSLEVERIVDEMNITDVKVIIDYSETARAYGEFKKEKGTITLYPEIIDKLGIRGNPYVDKEKFVRGIISHEYAHAVFISLYADYKYSDDEEARQIFDGLFNIPQDEWGQLASFTSYGSSYWKDRDYTYDKHGKMIAIDETLAEVVRFQAEGVDWNVPESLKQISGQMHDKYARKRK